MTAQTIIQYGLCSVDLNLLTVTARVGVITRKQKMSVANQKCKSVDLRNGIIPVREKIHASVIVRKSHTIAVNPIQVRNSCLVASPPKLK
tara:strand:+ start:195 stop:464 length:270 start_codon:yes stop_codon:yes gene_type:complete